MSTPHPSDPPNPRNPGEERLGDTDALLLRYQEANAHDPARPGDALRATVLEQARAAVAVRAKAASPDAASESLQRHAANDSRWTWRAFGGLAVVGLAGLLFMQFERGNEGERDAALGTPSASASASVSAPAPTPAPAPAPAPAQHERAASPMMPADAVAPAAAPHAPAKKPAAEPGTRANSAGVRGAASGQVSDLADPAPEALRAPSAAAAPQPQPAPAQADAEPEAAPTEAAEARRSRALDRADLAKESASAASRAPNSAERRAQIAEAPPASPSPASASASEPAPSSPAWFRAADEGNVNALQAQWTLGADVNQRNAQGRTALMSAAARGHTEAVRALLQAGANPRLRDGQGNTALDLAGAPSQQQVPALLDLLRAAQAAP